MAAKRVYYHRKFCKVKELKRAMTTKWQKFSQRFINKTLIGGVVD